MRRAKIVCTMGPAVESVEKVSELIRAGMNVARLNLSHGGYEEHQNRLDLVRAEAARVKKPVAIMVDLQGPKIRLGRFETVLMSYSVEILSQSPLRILLATNLASQPPIRVLPVIAELGI